MSDNENKGNMTQTWVISLAISVFCCALFFAFLSTYVNAISQTLTKIDERLANIEAQRVGAPAVVPTPSAGQQPPLGPFPTVIPPAPSAGEAAPSVAPAPVEAVVSPEAPPAPPVPPALEAATPNLPSVPAAAAPVEPEKK